ncbi:phytanoyl-CoA hydroxylase [Cladophialophora psammophila CBS 110553]|uniref:Phytanoyl-CoA hydroxylase n=1 Tax=Cladophialophora psammophila CBS 110553 TaxID=1182543 RepID=W9WHM0_9EURO|nr:phytanoyl-CoA hydroxylase [Cladophialophora psammophila CBS 110553]EXJ67642.1 phytanoyl-CoA hydroxylase [Cladophialophora psammophila CBS 110553]
MPHAESPEPLLPWEEQLFVNDGPLTPDQYADLRPTTLDIPIEEARKRYEEDGYLFIKGLLPREDVLKAREEYFKLLSPSGVLKPGTKPVDGIFDETKDKLDFPGIGAGFADANGRPTGPHPEVATLFVELALKAHTEDWYKEDFCKHPALRNYIAKLTGWGDDTLGIRRTLLRNNTPGNKAIGVHYDQIFLRHGEDTAVTAWVPMGDISRPGGGLIYLDKGHTLGAEMEHDFTTKAKATGLTDDEAKSAFNQNMMSGGLLADGPAEFGKQWNRRWLLTAYEAGDVVLHNAYAIHASTINHDLENRIRLGTDLRFVNQSRPWDTRWANDYTFGDGV